MGSFTNPYPASRLTVDSTNSLVTGMQAWFPLTQGSGTVAQCILHPSHTGTIGSGVTWESSERGTVAVFDGTSNARISLSSALISGQTLSFSVWLYINTSTAARVQIYSSAYAGHVKNQFRFSPLFNNFTFDQYPPGGGGIDTPADTGVEGRWVHAVVTQDSSDTKIYYDGELKVTGTAETYSGSAPTVFDIGSDNGANSFDGKMQNFQAWDRVITADEVALLHSRPWEGSNYGDIWPYSPPASASMTLSTDTAATSLMTNCVGWWPLTTGTGTAAKDIVGTNDGTLTNVDWLDSELGMSSDFQTEVGGDHITTSFSAAGQSEITVSFWMRNDGGATPNTYGRLLSMGFLNALDCFINKSSNNSLSFAVNSTNAYFSSLPPIGEWFHFCGVWSQSSRQELYINGSQVATATADTSVIGSGSHNVIIGGTTSGPRTFHGGIQNVRIWDRALSSDEVAVLADRPWEGIQYGDTFHYDPPAPASMLPLTSDAINTDQVGWWPLTETDDYASGAADISGSGNNGTQSGGVISEVSLLGGVASFDGANDYMEFSHSAELSFDVAAGATFSAWVKPDDLSGGTTFGTTNPRNIITKYAANVATANYFFRLLGGSINFGYRNSANTSYVEQRSDSEVITVDSWNHVAAVHTGTAIDLYLNGVEVASTNTSGTVTDSSNTNSDSVIIGRNGNANNRYFDGNISNARIWSRVLTADEIWSIYTNPWLGSNYKLASGSTDYNFIFRSKRFRRLA